MEHNVFICDMYPGQELEGFYILKEAAVKTTAAGKPFLTGTIADTSGNMELKVWDYSGPIDAGDAGKVIKLRGLVSEYRGSPQISASRIRLADGNDIYDISALVPTAPIDAELAIHEVYDIVDSMTDLEYSRICRAMLERHEDEFMRIPAAKSVHHGFISGLLMHTVNMLKTADFLAALYDDVIDRDLLLTGTLLHDIAKAQEFCFSELGMVVDYSVKGQLLGHPVMGAQQVYDICRELSVTEQKSVLLQHMLLSHHGQPEFGAAVMPQCAEAELLHLIDAIDSRMEIYAETLQNVPAGQFSARVFALEKKIFNHGQV